MTRAQRITLLVGGAVVAVAALLILRPDDEDESARQASSAPTETSRSSATVGGEAKVSVEKGDTIPLPVRSDVADEVHVHGYDLSRSVAPGRPVRMSFKADLEGVFEVELEHRAVPIAQLEVNP